MEGKGISLSEYIEAMGVNKFCDLVKVTKQTAYAWKEKKAMPQPSTAFELIGLSRNILTWESIYSPYFKGKEYQLDLGAQS